MRKQDEVRTVIHTAVHARDFLSLRAVVDSLDASLLVEIEKAWVHRELESLRAEWEADRALQEATAELSAALESDDLAVLETAAERGREAGVGQDLLLEAAERLASLYEERERQQRANAAWKLVYGAIEAGNVDKLVKLLETVKEDLTPEKLIFAQKKIPSMQALAALRKEIALVMRAPDVQHIKHLIFSAKGSCLPQGEVAALEEKLKEMQIAVAVAKEAEKVQQAAKVKQDEKTGREASIKELADGLSQAAKSGKTDEIRQALNKLKASGLSAREVHGFYTRAMEAAKTSR